MHYFIFMFLQQLTTFFSLGQSSSMDHPIVVSWQQAQGLSEGFTAQLCHALRVPELSWVISQWHETNWNPNRCLRWVRQVSAQARHEEALGRKLSFTVIQTTIWLRLIFTFSTICLYFGSQTVFFIHYTLFKYQGVRNPNEISLSKNWHWLAR